MESQNVYKDLLVVEKIATDNNIYYSASPLNDAHKSMENCDELEANIPKLSVMKKTNPKHRLPQYSEVLARSSEVGIKMEDLDLLQKDLETLLSQCAVKRRFLSAGAEPIYDHRKIRRNQGYKYQQKQQHLTSKLTKEKAVLPKTLHVHPNSMRQHLYFMPEMPRVNLSRNPVAENFWFFVEPYFANVVKDNLTFVDSLIKESMQDIYAKNSCTWNHFSAICPRNQQISGNQTLINNTSVNTVHKGIRLNSVEFVSRTNISRIHDLSLDLDGCVKEFTMARKNNLIALRKLRTTVRKKMCAQMKLAARKTSH